MRKMVKYLLVAGMALFSVQPAFAAGPPAPSPFSNPMAVTMIVLMSLMLIIIGILANILLGTADIRLKKRKKEQNGLIPVLVLLAMLVSPAVFAQGGAATPAAADAGTKTIAGMDSSTFYIMATILFLELFIIIALLINIKFLLRNEKERMTAADPQAAAVAEKKASNSWWNKINKFKPVSEEADIDLGHDYDGIRELDNRLPPWWLYGFYFTILFAGIYLWRYHVSHTAPLSGEEFNHSMIVGQQEVDAYIKSQGDVVDENTVKVSTDKADIEAGKAIFTNPSNCPTCHGANGSGYIQPGIQGPGVNLTDDYYIYGGDIKSIFKTIKYGTARGMKSWKDDLTPRQIAQVANYVMTLRGTKPAEAKPAEPDAKLYVPEGATKDSVKTTAAKDSVVTK